MLFLAWRRFSSKVLRMEWRMRSFQGAVMSLQSSPRDVWLLFPPFLSPLTENTNTYLSVLIRDRPSTLALCTSFSLFVPLKVIQRLDKLGEGILLTEELREVEGWEGSGGVNHTKRCKLRWYCFMWTCAWTLLTPCITSWWRRFILPSMRGVEFTTNWFQSRALGPSSSIAGIWFGESFAPSSFPFFLSYIHKRARQAFFRFSESLATAIESESLAENHLNHNVPFTRDWPHNLAAYPRLLQGILLGSQARSLDIQNRLAANETPANRIEIPEAPKLPASA